MARDDRPTAGSTVASWALLEAALATSDGPQLWEQHWRAVRTLRRAYARTVAGLGTLFGPIAGMGAYTIAANWHEEPLFVAVLLGTGLVVLGFGLRQVTAATVAPFVPKPRHLWLCWAAAPLFLLVALSGLLVEHNTLWAVAGGLLVAAPMWAAAIAEHREPVPQFPAAWRPFLRN